MSDPVPPTDVRGEKLDVFETVARCLVSGEEVEPSANDDMPNGLQLSHAEMKQRPILFQLVSGEHIEVCTWGYGGMSSSTMHDPWMQFVNPLLNQHTAWPLSTDEGMKPGAGYQVFKPVEHGLDRSNFQNKLVLTSPGRGACTHIDDRIKPLNRLADFFKANHYDSEWHVSKRENGTLEIKLVLSNYLFTHGEHKAFLPTGPHKLRGPF